MPAYFRDVKKQAVVVRNVSLLTILSGKVLIFISFFYHSNKNLDPEYGYLWFFLLLNLSLFGTIHIRGPVMLGCTRRGLWEMYRKLTAAMMNAQQVDLDSDALWLHDLAPSSRWRHDSLSVPAHPAGCTCHLPLQWEVLLLQLLPGYVVRAARRCGKQQTECCWHLLCTISITAVFCLPQEPYCRQAGPSSAVCWLQALPALPGCIAFFWASGYHAGPGFEVRLVAFLNCLPHNIFMYF